MVQYFVFIITSNIIHYVTHFKVNSFLSVWDISDVPRETSGYQYWSKFSPEMLFKQKNFTDITIMLIHEDFSNETYSFWLRASHKHVIPYL